MSYSFGRFFPPMVCFFIRSFPYREHLPPTREMAEDAGAERKEVNDLKNYPDRCSFSRRAAISRVIGEKSTDKWPSKCDRFFISNGKISNGRG